MKKIVIIEKDCNNWKKIEINCNEKVAIIEKDCNEKIVMIKKFVLAIR